MEPTALLERIMIANLNNERGGCWRLQVQSWDNVGCGASEFGKGEGWRVKLLGEDKENSRS